MAEIRQDILTVPFSSGTQRERDTFSKKMDAYTRDSLGSDSSFDALPHPVQPRDNLEKEAKKSSFREVLQKNDAPKNTVPHTIVNTNVTDSRPVEFHFVDSIDSVDAVDAVDVLKDFVPSQSTPFPSVTSEFFITSSHMDNEGDENLKVGGHISTQTLSDNEKTLELPFPKKEENLLSTHIIPMILPLLSLPLSKAYEDRSMGRGALEAALEWENIPQNLAMEYLKSHVNRSDKENANSSLHPLEGEGLKAQNITEKMPPHVDLQGISSPLSEKTIPSAFTPHIHMMKGGLQPTAPLTQGLWITSNQDEQGVGDQNEQGNAEKDPSHALTEITKKMNGENFHTTDVKAEHASFKNNMKTVTETLAKNGEDISVEGQELKAAEAKYAPSLSQPLNIETNEPLSTKQPLEFTKVLDQFREPLQKAIQGKENVMEVILNPEGLGHLRIEFNFEEKHVRTHFEAKDPGSLHYLKQHEGKITEIFAASGFSSDQNSLSFSLSQHSQGQHKNDFTQDANTASQQKLKEESPGGQTISPTYHQPIQSNHEGTFALSV